MPIPKEASFPVTYRAAQVNAILDAVARCRSIAVYGLAGMGKSNIFRFLASHPKVKEHYLPQTAATFQFVTVDCNLSDADTEDGLLRELDFQLARAGLAPERAFSQNIAPRQAIRLRLEAMHADKNLVILLDPLDRAFAQFSQSFWAYLRALRDIQGNVIYVFGARRPPPPLCELQELFVEACWVTPLTRPDAQGSLARDARRLNVTFTNRDINLLMELSGNHPGLLKNCAELVGRGAVTLHQPSELLARELLAYETIQAVCRDLWTDLKAEWKILQGLALGVPPNAADAKILEFLRRAGVLGKTQAGYELFSPLLRAYIISDLPRVIRVHVRASEPVTLESWQGTHTLRLGESALQLLRVLAQAPEEIHPRARLARTLALGDPHYSDEAVMAHIKRLRKSLNAALRPLLIDDRFDAILAARKQGYRLQLQAAHAWRVEYEISA